MPFASYPARARSKGQDSNLGCGCALKETNCDEYRPAPGPVCTPLGHSHGTGTGTSPNQPLVKNSGPSSHKALSDYLESLGAAEPRVTSACLLRDFGSVAAVLAASFSRLKIAVGSGLASTIVASRRLMKAALVERVSKRPVIRNRRALVALLRTQMALLTREQVWALYVDSRLQLLAIERISDGGNADAPLDAGRIIHLALDIGAYGFLLVHNHPSGDASPSDADQRATARLADTASGVGIRLLDHLIVAGSEVRSMMEVERTPGSDARP